MKPTGGWAFHVTRVDDAEEGLTVRDYFAAAFLCGVMSDRSNVNRLFELAGSDGQKAVDLTAEEAYRFADAMLKERAK